MSDSALRDGYGIPVIKRKLTIVGAGAVGTSALHWAMQKAVAEEIVLIDVVKGLSEGKALDAVQSSSLCRFSGQITGTTDYEATKGSHCVIITAGLARRPGMSRDDLLDKNIKIVSSVTENIIRYSPETVLIVVTNPIDAMVYTAFKVSGLPKSRVIGMAGALDSARYRCLIARELGVSPEDVSALVMGIHGDNMLPLTRLASVGGVPVEAIIPRERLEEIVKKTQHGGAEIVGLLKTQSAFTTPGLCAVEMAEAVLRDKRRVLPCAAYLEGEFGVNGLFLGAPVVIGGAGIERIIEFPLTDEEKDALKLSVEAVERQVEAVNRLLM